MDMDWRLQLPPSSALRSKILGSLIGATRHLFLVRKNSPYYRTCENLDPQYPTHRSSFLRSKNQKAALVVAVAEKLRERGENDEIAPDSKIA